MTVSTTKFNHVVASISPQAAASVRDIIKSPPAVDPYQGLKDALIRRNAPTRHQCLQRLLHHTVLGDRKPSELLRSMRRLHDDATDTDLFKELFLSRMPKETRAVLTAADPATSLDNLADMADRMFDCSQPAADPFPLPSPSVSEVQRLSEEVAALRLRKVSRSSSAKGGAPAPPTTPVSFCWYHARFGPRARACTPPCSYDQPAGNASAGH